MGEKLSTTDKKPEAKSQNSDFKIQRKNESFLSMNSPVDQILFLQKTIGNRAVSRLIKSGALQTKLRIGRPGDRYEQEADRVAEHVMRMPEYPEQARDAGVRQKCSGCMDNVENETQIQTKENSGQLPEVTPQVETNIGSLKAGGQPLPESTRAFMEPRFGHNFSQVRTHTDASSAKMTDALNAEAFTIGNDIYLAPGKLQPQTKESDMLLAHELAHVVQQSRMGPALQPKLLIEGRGSDVWELINILNEEMGEKFVFIGSEHYSFSFRTPKSSESSELSDLWLEISLQWNETWNSMTISASELMAITPKLIETIETLERQLGEQSLENYGRIDNNTDTTIKRGTTINPDTMINLKKEGIIKVIEAIKEIIEEKGESKIEGIVTPGLMITGKKEDFSECLSLLNEVLDGCIKFETSHYEFSVKDQSNVLPAEKMGNVSEKEEKVRWLKVWLSNIVKGPMTIMSANKFPYTSIGNYSTGDLHVEDVKKVGILALIHEITEQSIKQQNNGKGMGQYYPAHIIAREHEKIFLGAESYEDFTSNSEYYNIFYFKDGSKMSKKTIVCDNQVTPVEGVPWKFWDAKGALKKLTGGNLIWCDQFVNGNLTAEQNSLLAKDPEEFTLSSEQKTTYKFKDGKKLIMYRSIEDNHIKNVLWELWEGEDEDENLIYSGIKY